ncbi:MAG: mucoidy inhibitor MuiA family protein [Bacteroidetes bacterium]|nr:mucoidy inhibitor MuiA family protein [Bacteroidota bacterium]
MKNIFITSLIAIFPIILFSQENEKKVKSEIKDVTVFLSGASVTSSGSTTIDAGPQDLVFENLSPYIDANSIEAKGEGAFTILAVTFRTNYLNNQPKTKEIKQLEDSLEMLQLKITVQQNLRNVYESEESMLLANKSIGGQNVGVNSAELEKVANILRTRLTDLNTKEMECSLKEKKLNEEIVKVQSQLNEANAKRNKNTGEVVVSVTALTAVNAKLSLTYNVMNAGWSPIYDLRAEGNNPAVKLEYRANVWQNTGVEWKNVKLNISTGNPSVSGTKPTLNPWWLSFYSPISYKKYSSYGKQKNAQVMADMPVASGEVMKEEAEKTVDANYASDYTTVSESAVTVEYEISIPYNIASDNKPHSVSIQSLNIPAAYRYYCAPKLDPDAFLLAKITGWDKYNLLSGNLNIFFEGTFVGTSYLDTHTTTDTLDISLGRDKNVVVKRTLLKDFSDKKIIGLNKKESRAYEISIRNKKKAEIEIDIEDQIPLSTSNEIEIESLETSGAKYNKETGLLTWNLKVATGEEKKFRFSFSVKYPKDKVLSNL